MKFVLERGQLLDALSFCGRVAARRNTIPILGHVLIAARTSAVAFTTTDMDRLLTAETDALVDKTGSATANVHSIASFVRATPDGSQIELELARERLHLRAGKARASLPTLPAADFPTASSESYEASFEVKAATLAVVLGRVVHAQSREETRYYLNGVFLQRRDDGLRLTATDGHRLATARLEAEGDAPAQMPGIILPRLAIADLQAFTGEADGLLFFELSATRCKVSFDRIVYTTKLVDGTFPDYDRVIPTSGEIGVLAARKELMSAIERCASIGGDETSHAVRLSLLDNVLQLSRKSPDLGDVEDQLDATLRGSKSGDLGFNSVYLLDALEACGGDQVDIEFTPGSPVVVRNPAERDTQIQVVMPMRV